MQGGGRGEPEGSQGKKTHSPDEPDFIIAGDGRPDCRRLSVFDKLPRSDGLPLSDGNANATPKCYRIVASTIASFLILLAHKALRQLWN
jgi:hypothetical protein